MSCRDFGLGNLGQSWKNIDEVNRSVRDCACFAFESGWPMNDAGAADAAFELVLLVVAEWRVAGPRPAGGIGQECFAIGRFDVEKRLSAIVRAGSVVGDEKDEGVVELLVLFEVLDETTNLLVNPVNHGGKRYHTIDLVLLLPRNDLIPRADVRWAWAGFEIVGENSQLLLFADAGVTNLVPAGIIAALVLGVVFREGMERSVGSIEGEVEVERIRCLS